MGKVFLNAREKQIMSDEWCRRYYADVESGYIDISFRDGVEWADEHPAERDGNLFMVELNKEQCNCILAALRNLTENDGIKETYEKIFSLVNKT